ncbi:TetR/AcrR family transcriptional regulator [Pseudomonas protegens]|uniref:TetR/AcrR family transcriptional regulator n=1 Tax=Pseudomonas protegens TaxID=380021 RepID=UPI003158E31B
MSIEKAAPRRRNQATLEVILTATYELLQQNGYDRLTIEGVAARAGVGKTTIYRWWPSRGALAVDAFLAVVSPRLSFNETESASDDIRRQVRRLAAVYDGEVGKIVREMMGSAQFDSTTLALFNEGYLQPRRIAAKAALQRGIEQGEFRADINPEHVIDALYGPIYYRLLTGASIREEAFLSTLEAYVLDGISLKSTTCDQRDLRD